MSSRRKVSPAPLIRNRDLPRRTLTPASGRSFALPTVAALMLVAAGCASRPTGEHIERDDPKVPAPVATATTAPSASASIGGASMVDPIPPDPQELDGHVAIVKPVPKGPPKTYVAPTAKPHALGGDMPATMP